MNNKQTVAAIIASAVGGYSFGVWYTLRTFKRELQERRALVIKGVTSAVEKALDGELTTEEFVAKLNEEMEFVKIVKG